MINPNIDGEQTVKRMSFHLPTILTAFGFVIGAVVSVMGIYYSIIGEIREIKQDVAYRQPVTKLVMQSAQAVVVLNQIHGIDTKFEFQNF